MTERKSGNTGQFALLIVLLEPEIYRVTVPGIYQNSKSWHISVNIVFVEITLRLFRPFFVLISMMLMLLMQQEGHNRSKRLSQILLLLLTHSRKGYLLVHSGRGKKNCRRHFKIWIEKGAIFDP